MSSYVQFESDNDTMDHIVGSYCYYDNNFAVITNISLDECVIFDLFKRQRKTVKLQSLTLITKSSDIEKAKRMHQKYENKKNNAMEMATHKSQQLDKLDDTVSVQQISSISNIERRFCGPKCGIHALYGICLTLFLISNGFAVWFLYYGLPLVSDGDAFQKTLIKSRCLISNYEAVGCSYDCYECDGPICRNCEGPFCNECNAGAYRYYATSSSLCGHDIKLESMLNYGECPVKGNELLTMNIEYDCYISVTDNNCQYNGKNVFVFKDNDQSISIGQKYVDIGYIGIGLGCLCLSVIIGIKCRKCIKNLPCMN